MIRIASLTLLLLSLTLFASPAFCKDAGYQDYLLQVPGFNEGEVNCAAQPANQYYNPAEQQQQSQYNQIVSPTQVPQYGAQGYDSMGGSQQQNFGMQQQSFGTQSFEPMPGQKLSAYQQQEMALHQSQMTEQLEDANNQKQLEESFRMSGEFNDKSSDPSSGKKNKAKGVGSSMGRMLKGGLRYATPAAGTVASVFLLRAAFGGSMVAMPMMGGGMMIAPGH